MAEKLIELIISADDQATRIDKFLSSHPEIKTRSRAEHLILNRCVVVNSKIIRSSYKLKPGDVIQIKILEEKKTSSLKKLALDLDIVFEDPDLIVLNKPSGIVVHPAAGHHEDTLVNALINHTKDLSMKFGEDRPGIVHRIDKDTSGLLVIAKNDGAHLGLSTQFKNRTVQRFYEAIALGSLSKNEGKITSFLARHPKDRKRYSSVRDSKNKIITDPLNPPDHGKVAVTNFRQLYKNNGLCLLQLKLETGRTHQIRVHLSEQGTPILGDISYGSLAREKNLKPELLKEFKLFHRFFLHAKTLGFLHPRTGENLFFERDWPDNELNFINKWLRK